LQDAADVLHDTKYRTNLSGFSLHYRSVVLHDAKYRTNLSGFLLHYRSVALHDAKYPTNLSGFLLHYRSVGLHFLPNLLGDAVFGLPTRPFRVHCGCGAIFWLDGALNAPATCLHIRRKPKGFSASGKFVLPSRLLCG
jgi:hypothetical protein